MERYAGQYTGRQYVGIDLHRRRSVVVHITDAGELLEAVQVTNSPLALAEVMTRAGEHPEVVLEATYGWYWAVDTLAECGASTHLAHPAGCEGVRVPQGQERLPRLLRSCRSVAHGAPARGVDRPAGHEGAAGVGASPRQAGRDAVPVQGPGPCGPGQVRRGGTDERPVRRRAGTDLLDRLALPAAYAARIASLRRIMDLLDFEIDVFAGLTKTRLAGDPGYTAVQTIPGIGPVLGAVLVAEIGDIHRFFTPEKLTCWAGMTPTHRESDTTVRRGRITKQGSRLVRWAAVESVQRLPATTRLGAFRDTIAAKRGHNIAVVAAGRRQLEYVFYALRDHHVTADLHTPATTPTATTSARTAAGAATASTPLAS